MTRQPHQAMAHPLIRMAVIVILACFAWLLVGAIAVLIYAHRSISG